MDDPTLASIAIVTSGAAHAAVNTILKAGSDKLSSRALIDGASALVMLPVVFFVPAPAGSVGWLAASWLLHLVYLASLVQAFQAGDMMVAYPVARGLAPVIAAALAVVVFDEPLTWRAVVGVSLVSTGVLMFGLTRTASFKAIAWSCVTGLTIGAYTAVDAQGVRAAPSALSYVAWVFVTLGFGIGGLFAAWRGPRFVVAARREWRAGVLAGALSIVTYGLALWAYRLDATPRLAALRECSIVFAVLLAVVVLREKLTRAKVGALCAIVLGALVLLVR